MKSQTLGVVVALIVALGAGYWAGKSKVGAGDTAKMDAPATMAATGAEATAAKPRKLLYYRNPMGLPDTSPVPKKDSMGMDYIAVHEGEDEPSAAGELKISTEKVQKLGVKTEPATVRELARQVTAAGRVEIDERRVHTVSAKFEGWIERLHVNATGQPVGKGQPLFEVYSPELVSAQREYALAARGIATLKDASPETQSGMKQLADAGLARLRNWDISEEQVKALAAGGEARRTLTFLSPAGGVVLEKKAVAGMRFMPGEMLYQIADISAVWVLADIFERDIAQVKPGQKVKVAINAYPDKTFSGTIAYIYPTLKADTRTIPVRVELANPGGLLKPAMYANVELAVGAAARVLTVPLSAVIDSGTRQVVLVQKAAGRFEPREVKLGQRSDDYVEVREGIAEGDAVVVAANFLIDAESNLKAAFSGLTAAPEAGSAKAAAGKVSHLASGTLESIDLKGGIVTMTHGPVPSLSWPAMTMDFILANPGLVAKLKSGSPVAIEFVERGPGEWVITKMEAKGAAAANAAPAAAPAAAHIAK
jgi:Cu(I)/Ag(I) efflux system membrane fusion protein